MSRTISVDFRPAARRGATASTSRRHALSRCEETELARFRDRHQARDGARALSSGCPADEVDVFACPDCRGWHVERSVRPPLTLVELPRIAEPSAACYATGKRRYFLVDIENPTLGAKATVDQVAKFWDVLKHQAPGVAAQDHVVVGASRSVARKYRGAIHGANVKWVVGADAPEAADNALLAAIDLRRVARDYDELVIVSGDHAFTHLARRARTAGLTVRVVTAEHPENRSMLSRDLAAAADVRTVVRLQSRSQRTLTIRAARAMSAAWRRRDNTTLAA